MNKWKAFGLTGICATALSFGVALKSARDYFKERTRARCLQQEIYAGETDNFPLQLGYKVFASNSSLKDAKLVVLAEKHYKDDEKHSEFFRHYIQDKDIILLEGEPKAENLESLLDDCESAGALKAVSKTMTPEFNEFFFKMAVSFLHPELYGVKQSGKKPRILGADDMKAYFESAEAETRYAEAGEELDGEDKREICLNQITKYLIKRDNSMLSSIIESKKYSNGKIYLIVGKGHIDQSSVELLRIPNPEDWLVNKIRLLGINYVVYVPDKTKDKPETLSEEISEDEAVRIMNKITKARKREDDYKKRFKPKKEKQEKQEFEYKPI